MHVQQSSAHFKSQTKLFLDLLQACSINYMSFHALKLVTESPQRKYPSNICSRNTQRIFRILHKSINLYYKEIKTVQIFFPVQNITFSLAISSSRQEKSYDMNLLLWKTASVSAMWLVAYFKAFSLHLFIEAKNFNLVRMNIGVCTSYNKTQLKLNLSSVRKKIFL